VELAWNIYITQPNNNVNFNCIVRIFYSNKQLWNWFTYVFKRMGSFTRTRKWAVLYVFLV